MLRERTERPISEFCHGLWVARLPHTSHPCIRLCLTSCTEHLEPLESWRYQLSFLNHAPGRGLLFYPASLFHWEVLVCTWFCCCPQENELPLCELEYLPSYLRIILSEISFWNEKRFSIAICCPRVSVGGGGCWLGYIG